MKQHRGAPLSSAPSSSLLSFSFFSFFCTLLLLLSTLSLPADAAVHVGNTTYASLPGLFGKVLPPGRRVSARLQFLHESPFLCEYLQANKTSFVVPPPSSSSKSNSNNNNHQHHQLPIIALLAARGQCPFLRKALVAEQLDASILYLIVYNDNRDGEDVLVPMYSEFGESRLVLLSVSHQTGQALKKYIVAAAEQTSTSTAHLLGGPIISLDASLPEGSSILSLDDLRNLLLSALVLFFALIAISGCVLLLASQYGHVVYVSHNRIVLARHTTRGGGGATDPNGNGNGDGNIAATNGGRIVLRYALGSSRLLTEAQVQQLAKDQQATTRQQWQAMQAERRQQQEKEKEEQRAENNDNDNSMMDDDTSSLQHACAICIEDLFDTTTDGVAVGENDEEEEDINSTKTTIIDSLVTLPCHHTFHLDCLLPWLTERQSKCPLCKFNVFDHIHQPLPVIVVEGGGGDDDDDAQANSNTNTTLSPPRRPRRSFWQRLVGGNYTPLNWNSPQRQQRQRLDGDGGSSDEDFNNSHDSTSTLDGTNVVAMVELTRQQQHAVVEELEAATAHLQRQVHGTMA